MNYRSLAGLDDELGALVPMRQPRGRGAARQMLSPQATGIPNQGRLRQPLGFGTVVFNLAAALTPQTVQFVPQKNILIRRLIIDDTARIGTTSTGLVTMTRFVIGPSDQLQAASGNPVPVKLLGPTATDIDLVCTPANFGQTIFFTFQVSTAVTTTDSITVSIGAIVETVG